MSTLEDREGELIIANLRFSRSRCALWIDDDEIPLTRRDVLLLELLLHNVGKIVTRDAMIEQAWGTEFDGSERAVDVHLSRLRRRVFDRAACPLKIKSVRGMGYKVIMAMAFTGASKPEPASWPMPGFQPRVLVVDDNVVTRTAAARILSKLGCQVDQAGTGAEAVEMVGHAAYQLIFMDVEMPELDGYGATRIIRNRHTGEGVPAIIAMTAHCLPEDREKCWEVGMDDFLAKPITRQSLAAMLSRWTSANSPAGRPVEPGQPPVVDIDDLWHLVDHDPALLDEMTQAFIEDWALMRRDLQVAIVEQQAATIAQLSNRLIDTLLSLAAPRAMAAARQLENIGRFSLTERAMQQFEILAVEIEALQRALLNCSIQSLGSPA
jgi:DNA-binding response OmpR family regulator